MVLYFKDFIFCKYNKKIFLKSLFLMKYVFIFDNMARLFRIVYKKDNLAYLWIKYS